MFNTVCFIDSYKWLTVVLKSTELKLEPLCKIKSFISEDITCKYNVYIYLYPSTLDFGTCIINNFFFNILRFLQTNVLNIALTSTVWLYVKMEPFISKNITLSSLIFSHQFHIFTCLLCDFVGGPCVSKQ